MSKTKEQKAEIISLCEQTGTPLAKVVGAFQVATLDALLEPGAVIAIRTLKGKLATPTPKPSTQAEQNAVRPMGELFPE